MAVALLTTASADAAPKHRKAKHPAATNVANRTAAKPRTAARVVVPPAFAPALVAAPPAPAPALAAPAAAAPVPATPTPMATPAPSPAAPAPTATPTASPTPTPT